MVLTSCSPKLIYKSQWQSAPVIIDGSVSEYQDFRFYNKETKMFYSLYNDNANLYVCLKTNDEAMQMKIMKVGMEIWIDTLEKSKEQNGILFPLAKGNSINMDGMKPQTNHEKQKPDFNTVKNNFFLEQNFMILVGFKNTTKGLTSLEDKSGIKVKINWDSTNSMIYEAIIPFITFYKESLSNIDSTKFFTLTLNINAFSIHEMPQNGGPDYGRMSGGIDMPGGGEMPNGPPNEIKGTGNMNTMSEKNTFIEKFKLEVKEP